jgi:hypothetical protein
VDLDFLPCIVRQDNEGAYPSAERALRHQLGCFGFSYSRQASRNPMVGFPKTNDPTGIVRTMYNLRAGPPVSQRRQHSKARFLDREDVETR